LNVTTGRWDLESLKLYRIMIAMGIRR